MGRDWVGRIEHINRDLPPQKRHHSSSNKSSLEHSTQKQEISIIMSDNGGTYKPTEHGGLKEDGTPDKRVGTGGMLLFFSRSPIFQVC
jgi:hypothetical protein